MTEQDFVAAEAAREAVERAAFEAAEATRKEAERAAFEAEQDRLEKEAFAAWEAQQERLEREAREEYYSEKATIAREQAAKDAFAVEAGYADYADWLAGAIDRRDADYAAKKQEFLDTWAVLQGYADYAAWEAGAEAREQAAGDAWLAEAGAREAAARMAWELEQYQLFLKDNPHLSKYPDFEAWLDGAKEREDAFFDTWAAQQGYVDYAAWLADTGSRKEVYDKAFLDAWAVAQGCADYADWLAGAPAREQTAIMTAVKANFPPAVDPTPITTPVVVNGVEVIVLCGQSVLKNNEFNGTSANSEKLLAMGIVLYNGGGNSPPTVTFMPNAQPGLYTFHIRVQGGHDTNMACVIQVTQEMIDAMNLTGTGITVPLGDLPTTAISLGINGDGFYEKLPELPAFNETIPPFEEDRPIFEGYLFNDVAFPGHTDDMPTFVHDWIDNFFPGFDDIPFNWIPGQFAFTRATFTFIDGEFVFVPGTFTVTPPSEVPDIAEDFVPPIILMLSEDDEDGYVETADIGYGYVGDSYVEDSNEVDIENLVESETMSTTLVPEATISNTEFEDAGIPLASFDDEISIMLPIILLAAFLGISFSTLLRLIFRKKCEDVAAVAEAR